MPASCVQTLGGTAALLVSDRTSSLVTTSQSVSQSSRQNSPPTIRVNQMGALPVTPHQKVKRSVNCWYSSRDAPGEDQGVCNNKHNKCSVSANRQLTHTRSKLGQTAEPLTKWVHMSVSTITYRTDKRNGHEHSCILVFTYYTRWCSKSRQWEASRRSIQIKLRVYQVGYQSLTTLEGSISPPPKRTQNSCKKIH